MVIKNDKIERKERHLRWIPLGKTKISTMGQRDFNPAWADFLAQNMDIEDLGNPELNERDEAFYVMDGQHRIAALKIWLGEGWEGQKIQCWVTVGLTEKQEAETFLRLNNTLHMNSFQKFKVAIRAGRLVELEIQRVVLSTGLCISKSKVMGAVKCVSALVNLYKKSGPVNLGKTLRIIRDAYGDPGLGSHTIQGIGLLCHRYDGVLEEPRTISALGNAHGGVNGLLGMAEQIRQKTGNQKAHCVAAAAVEIINRKRGKKLPSWWKD